MSAERQNVQVRLDPEDGFFMSLMYLLLVLSTAGALHACCLSLLLLDECVVLSVEM